MAVGVLVALAVLLLAAWPASAGDDPYGGTTTTTEGAGAEATCALSATSGGAGAAVTATVGGVHVGETVRILFGGDEVAHEAAVGEAGAETTVQIDFSVPDVDSGSYSVAAVGATFTVECEAGADGFAVLGASVSNQGGGSLPKTGIYVALLLAIGAVLVLVGRALLAESRRRRAVGTGEPARRRAQV